MNNKTQITMIGTGYVGLISGICFSELGFQVICVDKDQNKINQLNNGFCPIYEPSLNDLLFKNLATKRLKFTHVLPEAIVESKIIFITVGTPISKDGQADISEVENITRLLAPLLNDYKVIVVKSTVPVGTGRRLAKLIRTINPKALFDIVSNPEFLRAGSGIQDFMIPDRIIIGTEGILAHTIMKDLYASFAQQGIPILFTELESSELIKYAANSFLATRIAFVNEMAHLCEKLGAKVNDVLYGIGLDKRIGQDYLKPGPGFGGSCLAKDALALTRIAQRVNAPSHIIGSVLESNTRHKDKILEKIISACSGSVANKRLAILGVSFKANTDDTRDSAALYIILQLQSQGAILNIYDPVVKKSQMLSYKNVDWRTNIYDSIKNVDAIVIMTEWDEFRKLDLKKVYSYLRNTMIKPTIIDFRNLYSPVVVSEAGIRYISIGRLPMEPVCEHNVEVDLYN